MDPTNDVVPSRNHVTLAWGRDYGDVSPVRGVILGGRDHTVDVGVDVAVFPERGLQAARRLSQSLAKEFSEGDLPQKANECRAVLSEASIDV